MHAYYKLLLGKDSFQRTLQEDQIWDIYKYWEMETVLFEIIQLYGCKQKITKDLAADLYYLSLSLNQSAQASFCTNDAWNIKNLSDDEVLQYLDRFNLIIQIFWCSHDCNAYQSFFEKTLFCADEVSSRGETAIAGAAGIGKLKLWLYMDRILLLFN